jgi:hypothetical protein
MVPRPRFGTYTVKKVSDFPFLAGMSRTKLSLAGDIKFFPSRESLISDIPAGDEKIANLFYTVPCRRQAG